MLLPVTHVLPLTTIERRRMLPVAGTVLVRSGQEVGASDVIATADVFAEHISLDLARGLGVPKAQVAELMQRKIGDKVAKGAVIASRPGVVSRVVRAACRDPWADLQGRAGLRRDHPDDWFLDRGSLGERPAGCGRIVCCSQHPRSCSFSQRPGPKPPRADRIGRALRRGRCARNRAAA